MDNEELLKKIAENTSKSLKYHRISAFCLIGILCVVLVSAYIVVPKAASTLNAIDAAARSSEETLSNASATLAEVNEMADSVTKTSDEISTFVNDNRDMMMESLDKMSQIDFDGLNQAIKDLQDAVGPFAKFMKSFGR
ncbi:MULTISPECIES: hypothetical protein [unclassified Butyrivibrio]|uniref:hypothetical protein n=1 Tax=unclassified Butyrivibrio TaxID=2639466 RepID=UPI00047B46A8|nr:MULTISPECIES: hypothetical protein [unclassified Butyrivibrio]